MALFQIIMSWISLDEKTISVFFFYYLYHYQYAGQRSADYGIFGGVSSYLGDINTNRLFYSPLPAGGITSTGITLIPDNQSGQIFLLEVFRAMILISIMISSKHEMHHFPVQLQNGLFSLNLIFFLIQPRVKDGIILHILQQVLGSLLLIPAASDL